MFLLGHVVTIAKAKKFPDVDLLAGEHVISVMLPDVIACHDWSYRRGWAFAGGSVFADLMCAHMVGDAVVHHGTRWKKDRKKVGWAYQHMGIVAAGYGPFFAHAEACGWRSPFAGRDSRRGWAHTMVEYSIDQWLADSEALDSLHSSAVSAAQETLQDPDWIKEVVENLGVETSKPLESQPSRYCGAIARASQPDEFHLRGLALKFGLAETDEVLDWLRCQLREVVRRIGPSEMGDVVAGLATAVASAIELDYPINVGDRWSHRDKSA